MLKYFLSYHEAINLFSNLELPIHSYYYHRHIFIVFLKLFDGAIKILLKFIINNLFNTLVYY